MHTMKEAADQRPWTSSTSSLPRLGSVVEYYPPGCVHISKESTSHVSKRPAICIELSLLIVPLDPRQAEVALRKTTKKDFTRYARIELFATSTALLSSIAYLELQSDILSLLSSHRDIYHTHMPIEGASRVREAIALHAINHVTKCVFSIFTNICQLKLLSIENDGACLKTMSA